MTTIEAIYENGVFKPIGEVQLPEFQRVTVIIGIPTDKGLSTGSPPRRSLKDLLGVVRQPGLPPTDDECGRMREEALSEKHGS